MYLHSSYAPALVFIHKCLQDTVIPAGIAGIQATWTYAACHPRIRFTTL